jgi:hypothetical protein
LGDSRCSEWKVGYTEIARGLNAPDDRNYAGATHHYSENGSRRHCWFLVTRTAAATACSQTGGHRRTLGAHALGRLGRPPRRACMAVKRRCRKVTGRERGRLAFCVLFAKSRYPGPRTTTDMLRYRSARNGRPGALNIGITVAERGLARPSDAWCKHQTREPEKQLRGAKLGRLV